MKKFVLMLILSIVLIPRSVFAASITKINSNLSNSNVKVGNYTTLSLELDIDYSDEVETSGLFMLMISYDYNDSDLIISDINTPGFESGAYIDTETNEQFIISIINFTKTCFDGVFFCGDYKLDLEFFLKDISKKSTNIVIKDIYLASTTYDLETQDFSEDDIKIYEKSYNKTYTINVLDGVVSSIPTTKSTSKIKVDTSSPIKNIVTTKKNTTKKTTSSTTTSSKELETTTEEKIEDIKKNDIVDNVVEKSKELINNVKKKDNRKKLIKLGIIILIIIILIITIIKLKNHKLNKQFKEF